MDTKASTNSAVFASPAEKCKACNLGRLSVVEKRIIINEDKNNLIGNPTSRTVNIIFEIGIVVAKILQNLLFVIQ
ncbi:hypothetical protein ABEB36_011021 [Hypothenemus hampei]|uniref:Uncharacterized protein n=1 Tax=Hypothenemus hampei TaxID=57062 RepID=A0ABD1EDY5_HYPHA